MDAARVAGRRLPVAPAGRARTAPSAAIVPVATHLCARLCCAALVVALAVQAMTTAPAAAASSAQSGPVSARLSGDRVELDFEAKVARAEGNVILTYDDLKIACDLLEVDTSSGQLVATGRVTFYDGEDVVTGGFLRYDLRAKRGEMGPGKATVTGEGIRGSMYVSGSGFAAEPGRVVVTRASLTTCDLEEPHYHIEATEIELYIDDRIVLRQVSYWEGKLRLFYWPYLVLPIREENRFDLPKIGYGPAEGWFVKTTYNYYRSPSYRGSVYLDYFTRLGVGTGLKHLYDASALGSGFVYVYGLLNRTTGHVDGEFEVSHEVPVGDGASATMGLSYSDAMSSAGILNTSVSGTVGVDYRGERARLSLSAENTTRRGEVSSDEIEGEIIGDGRFGDELSLSVKAAFLDRRSWDADDPDERFLNYRVAAVEDLGPVSVSATVEQYVKPSEQREKEEEGEEEPLPYEAIGRAPEIFVESRAFSLGSLPLDLKAVAGWGSYAERASGPGDPGVVKASRTELALLAPTQSYPLWGDARGILSAGLTFDAYSTGQTRYVAGASLGLETRVLCEALSLRTAYEYRGVFGETPFAFDAKSRTGLLTGRLGLASGIVTGSLEAGYDFYTHLYKDLAARVRVSSEGSWAVEAQAAYDPNESAMKHALGKIEFSPSERWDFRLGARYSFPRQALDRLESEVALWLSDAWKVEWVVVYGGTSSSKGVLRGDISVARDLHCREVRLSYSHAERQVWLEYRIKAFPYEGLRFGLGDEGLLF